jgi:hypothetical protein
MPITMSASLPRSSEPLSEFRHWALNSGTRIGLKLVSSVGNILLAGWLVKLLGTEYYGVFRSATAAISLPSLAEGRWLGVLPADDAYAPHAPRAAGAARCMAHDGWSRRASSRAGAVRARLGIA